MKVVFDFAAAKISIEGDEPQLVELLQIARQIAPSLAHIEISTLRPPKSLEGTASNRIGNTPDPANGGSNGSGGNSHSGETLKQFVRKLSLGNITERIAAIALYEKHHEGREVFSPKDMSDWFTFCGLQKPSQMPVAIFDAKRKYGFLESAGHAKWRLTTSGENLVVGKQNALEDDQKA